MWWRADRPQVPGGVGAARLVAAVPPGRDLREALVPSGLRRLEVTGSRVVLGRIALLVLALVWIAPREGMALFSTEPDSTPTPIARLIANMEQKAREHLEWTRHRQMGRGSADAENRWPYGRFSINYALARMHYFSAVIGEAALAGLSDFDYEPESPSTVWYFPYNRPGPRAASSPPATDTIRHFQAAVAYFLLAAKSNWSLIFAPLGHASLLEEFAHVASALPLPADATLLNGLAVPVGLEAKSTAAMRLLARNLYLDALRPCVEGDSIMCRYWPEAASESLAGYERMAKIVGPDRVRQASYRRYVTNLKRHCRRSDDCQPPTRLTPLILTTKRSTLTDLIDPTKTANFNLDGMGTRRWRWLRPTAGLLVWDPGATGQVKSGVQLFGTVTWWMFWPNGYAALRALDDNGDTWLRGAELTGIAVWFDRDQDGRSDPGEVVSLSSLGIKGLGTAISGREPAGLRADFGVEFSDGTVLPTWDWFPEAVTAGPAFSPFRALGGQK